MIRKITKLHPVCPHCGKTHGSAIDHIEPGGSFGPWFCDGCGQGFHGVMRGEATVIEKIPSGARFADTLVLLEYPPSDKPLRFLMRGRRYELPGDPGDMRFYYEQHSCPTNWIGQAVMISHGGCTDPHGFLRYVRETPCPDLPETSMGEDEVLVGLFPEMEDVNPVSP